MQIKEWNHVKNAIESIFQVSLNTRSKQGLKLWKGLVASELHLENLVKSFISDQELEAVFRKEN